MIIVDLMFNEGFIGDNQQVVAIQQQIEKKFDPMELVIHQLQDNDPQVVSRLKTDWQSDGQRILVLSGSHGLELIKREEVRELIEQKKPIVFWVGHQDPGVLSEKDLLSMVALPLHIIEGKPTLQTELGERLIAMQAVPNTLQEKDLRVAVEQWNSLCPESSISLDPRGYIGVFLGGDAPMPDNTHLYWSEKNAYELGQSFGKLAFVEKKFLIVTNGPRTGKYYPGSFDPRAPVIRQRAGKDWKALDQLTVAEQKTPDKALIPHAVEAPLDPVSAAFVSGVKASPLGTESFEFFDFKFGHSAYKAIVGALFAYPNTSYAFYSGESISYAEIGYFIPQTFAFEVDSMNEDHQRALMRFTQDLGMVGRVKFEVPLEKQQLDVQRKQVMMDEGSARDASCLVEVLVVKVREQLHEKGVKEALTWQHSRISEGGQIPQFQTLEARKSKQGLVG